MGTKALVIVNDKSLYDETLPYEKNNPIVASMYCQYDGYLQGVGVQLSEFLKDMTIVNGLSNNDKNVSNGMGCLAAQLISHFKKEAGGFYLTPIYDLQDILNIKSDIWVDWVYVIDKNNISVYSLDLEEGTGEDEHKEVFNKKIDKSWKDYCDLMNQDTFNYFVA